jgi:hypothetical protein
VTEGATLYESPYLLARAVSVAQLLAMKLAAWRDAIDRDDAELLILRMSGLSEAIWAAVWSRWCLTANWTKRGAHSKISGSQFMELPDLVRAVLSGNLLAARQWVADAKRARLPWELCQRPTGLDEREMIEPLISEEPSLPRPK